MRDAFFRYCCLDCSGYHGVVAGGSCIECNKPNEVKPSVARTPQPLSPEILSRFGDPNKFHLFYRVLVGVSPLRKNDQKGFAAGRWYHYSRLVAPPFQPKSTSPKRHKFVNMSRDLQSTSPRPTQARGAGRAWQRPSHKKVPAPQVQKDCDTAPSS